jgi:two-component system response regulator
MSPDQHETVLFGKAVRKQRFELGISQEELADRASLHRTYISDVELGLRNPSLKSITKLARALKLSPSTLFGDIDGHGPPATDRPIEILLVEDNPRDVESTLRAFWSANLSNVVNVARDGAEALSWLFPKNSSTSHALPGLLLLDLFLPKTNGLEILERLRADERTRHIPVVGLTEPNRHFDSAACQRLGLQHFLSNPVDFRDFSAIAPHLSLTWTLRKPLNGS